MEMKKILIGIMIGAVAATATSAYADVATMVGKVVDGSFPLIVNGQKAEKDAIVIEGTSYIPVRAAGELFGYDASFSDSKIILNRKGEKSVDTTSIDPATQSKIDKWEREKQENLDKIKAEEEAAAAEAEKSKAFLEEQQRKIEQGLKEFEAAQQRQQQTK